MKFKVGDWVIKGKCPFPYIVDGVYETGKIHIVNNNLNRFEYVYPTEISKWQPKEGEWFWYNKRLAKIVYPYRLEFCNGDELTVYGTLLSNDDETEPFIGELPSFIKENNEI